MASQVIAEVLSRASGISFEDLAKQYLFNPLFISSYYWDKYPGNNLPAWGGIALTTHDMAKIGLLILNKGEFVGNQIVSKAWIDESIASTVPYKDNVCYGLHWWVDKQKNGNPLIYAAGYGDQYVYVAPDKDIVIAINSQNFSDYRWPKGVDELVNSIISSISYANI
jgi:CubicO group peptidase (beta-lactamase class C family)